MRSAGAVALVFLAACGARHAAVEEPLPAPGRAPGVDAREVAPAAATARGPSPVPSSSNVGVGGNGAAPEPAAPPSSGAAELVVGWNYVAVRTTTGEVWTWNGHGLNYIPARSALIPTNVRATSLDHGDGELAVLEDGTVGQFGGTILEHAAGRLTNISNIRSVFSHRRRTYFTRRDGTVFVVAARGYEKSVAGQRPKRIFETREQPALTGIEELASSDAATCGRFRTREVRCWTTNPEKDEGATLVMLPLSFPPAQSLDVDFVVLADGTVRGWGSNDHAQLGDGTQEDRAAPVVIKDLKDVTQLARGPYSSCALHTSGKLSCWGDGTEYPMIPGQLVAVHPKPLPITLPAGNPPVAEVRIGVTTACARLVDGRIMCWGDNWQGEIGDGKFGGEREPTFVAGFGGPMPDPDPRVRKRPSR